MRVLVTAASKHGSTQMIGNEIVRVLRDRLIDAVFAAPEVVKNLHGYDAVVIGSAVYAGHWMKPATTFIEDHRAELRARPVWLFSSGPVGIPPVPLTEAGETESLVAAVNAREHRVFPGRLNGQHLGFVERTMVRMIHADEGDFRDWDAVQDWAKSIAQALLAGSLQLTSKVS